MKLKNILIAVKDIERARKFICRGFSKKAV